MGAGASSSQSIPVLPFDPNVFPKLGVKLSYLDNFFDYCGGRQCLEGLTTTDVNVRFVMPMTQESQSSVCDLLVYKKEKDKQGHAAVGIANVFISHAWKFKFLDVVDALLAHFKDQDNENVILWFDLFSNNQHKAVDLTFDYWSNTFKSAIKAFGHTVMVLSPWNDPVPLTRAWCLWELYCTVDTNSKFEIAMTQPSRNQFIEDVLKDPKGEINKMLGTINVERSECFKESDRESIFEAVRLTVGFSKLNSLIFERFRDWVISSMEEEMNSCEVNQRNPRYINSLGELHRGQGNYEKAEPLLEKSYFLSMELLGESHPQTLDSMHNLGSLYYQKQNIPKSKELWIRCLELRKEVLGESHPDTLISMNCLGMISYCLGQLHEAEEICFKCYELRKQILGENHVDTLQSMHSLATIYSDQRKGMKSIELYKRCLELRKRILGDSHPQTLDTMSNLAALYHQLGQVQQAELLSIQCYLLSKQIFGESHPDTLATMHNLSGLYLRQGKYDQSIELFSKCLELQKQTLSEEHPHTLTTMNTLGIIYKQRGRNEEAEELLEKCVQVNGQVLGETHELTFRAIEELSDLYQMKGKITEARELKKLIKRR